MNCLPRFRSWLRSISRRSRLEAEMDTELRWHFENYVEQLMRDGVSKEDARRRARLELGDIEVQKDKCRDSLGLRVWDEVRSDLRFGMRALVKNRLLTISLLLTLVMGIGISSGVFNCMSALFLRPWIANDRSSYVEIFPRFTMDPTRPMQASVATLEDYLALRGKSRTLDQLAAFSGFSLDLDSDDMSTTVGGLVSDNFFRVYGVKKAKLGRLLQPEDYSKSGTVAVLSEDLWRSHFAADPSIVGKVVRFNEHPVTVVGVVASFPAGSNTAGAWLPYTLATYLGLGDQWTRPGELRWLALSGRLNHGFSRADVASELATLIRQQDVLHHGRISQLIVTDGSGLQTPGEERARWLFGLSSEFYCSFC